MIEFYDGDVHLLEGDCLDSLRRLADSSVDAVVTDPPYAISFMAKGWDAHESPQQYQRWCEAWARECLRVLKPGGHLLAFGGTRTYHRLACAIEDAGFELRDSIDWIYGSGFPKSLDVGKATAAADWRGWGTALKPAHEPIIVARKHLAGTVAANVLRHGTGAINVDQCRVAWDGDGDVSAKRKAAGYSDAAKRALGTAVAVEDSTGFAGEVVGTDSSRGRWPANVVLTHAADCRAVGQARIRTDQHYPSRRGAGGIGNDGHAGQDDLAESGGDEIVDVYDCAPGCPVAELDAQSGVLTSGANPTRRGTDKFRNAYGDFKGQAECDPARGANSGGASRFFPVFSPDWQGPECCMCRGSGVARMVPADGEAYSRCPACNGHGRDPSDMPIFRYEPKAPTDERPVDGQVMHPTVKPLDLMRWLVRLVTPPGGLVLDPFAGSGTTGEAALREGMRAVLIERDADYCRLIAARLAKPQQATLL